MKAFTLLISLSVALWGGCQPAQKDSQTKAPEVSPLSPPPKSGGATGPRISGPFVHENLAVFLVHGPDTLTGQCYLTLNEALVQKKLLVHETGQVNELFVENVSDEEVFIQAGDIVRGGKQDRMLGTDFIVEAHSGRLPIESYCVEHGRWQRRGAESDAAFASSGNYAPSNSLKLAAKQFRNQQAVWNSVAESQARLAASVGVSVAATTSPTSLELTLNHAAIQHSRADYLKALSGLAESEPDVLGAVIAINGRLSSADVYGAHALFAKLWPRLLESAAVEALAAATRADAKRVANLSSDEVRAFLARSSGARAEHRTISRRVEMIVIDLNERVLFDTLDTKARTVFVHSNCLLKESSSAPPERGAVDFAVQRQPPQANGP
ncbi:MAG: DUF6569 family protein [Phycisphaerae bacterium]